MQIEEFHLWLSNVNNCHGIFQEIKMNWTYRTNRSAVPRCTQFTCVNEPRISFKRDQNVFTRKHHDRRDVT
jgi:hypothetical protein